jgi:hypothetical protein
VAPCGMILARETFYGAESIPSVVVSAIVDFFRALIMFWLAGNDQEDVSHSWQYAQPHLL